MTTTDPHAMDYCTCVVTLMEATGLRELTTEQDDLIACLVGALPAQTITALAGLLDAVRGQAAARDVLRKRSRAADLRGGAR